MESIPAWTLLPPPTLQEVRTAATMISPHQDPQKEAGAPPPPSLFPGFLVSVRKQDWHRKSKCQAGAATGEVSHSHLAKWLDPSWVRGHHLPIPYEEWCHSRPGSPQRLPTQPCPFPRHCPGQSRCCTSLGGEQRGQSRQPWGCGSVLRVLSTAYEHRGARIIS